MNDVEKFSKFINRLKKTMPEVNDDSLLTMDIILEMVEDGKIEDLYGAFCIGVLCFDSKDIIKKEEE